MVIPREFDAPLGGRFVVEHAVGEGATAVVFRAFDLESQRPVALKILHERQPGTVPTEKAPSLALAEAEARLLADVRHPAVIEVIAAGWLEDIQHAYLALEWVDGFTLERHHKVTPLGPREIIGLGVLLCRGLVALHEQHVVHQDIKPANILLRRRAASGDFLPELVVEPVLIDFGIATRGAATQLGGTPAYMSPEQARSDGPIDHRTDLYSLGATLFELFVGRPPHQGAGPLATLARLATTPAPRLASFRADLPPGVDAAIEALLQTDPEARPPNAAAAEELLLDSLHDEENPSFPETEASSRLGGGHSRLVTTMVAMNLAAEDIEASLAQVRQTGALGVRLGNTAIVAHWGVDQATGSEAAAGLSLALWLSQCGGQVGVASGRSRLQNARGGRVRPVGDVVDRAATLAREAVGGTVYSDATTTELGRGSFRFKMRSDGSAIVERALESKHKQQGGAPFVGRDTELAQVLGAYERTETERHPMVVSISGPPGIGKSRLQRECIARISSRAEAPRIVVQKSDAYGSRHILGAAADVLRRLIDLPQSADSPEVQSAIVERIGPETMSDLSQENRSVLTRLLAGDAFSEELAAGGARDATWLAMTELVTRVLSNEPVVLVLEDLQWADDESVAWFEHLLGRAAGYPLFVMACVRPGFWEAETERYRQRDHLRIDLRPISTHSVRMIAQSVLGQGARAEDLDGISARAGGSPLFAEELARLTARGKGSSAPTIEAAIEASLDALDVDCRLAVERLSVFGQSCWDAALDALGQPHSERVLARLVEAEVLREQSSSRFRGTREFAFKHALVRDVAYGALSEEAKTELHARAGVWLGQMGEDAATVAGHLDLGGLPERAAQHWERAAARALSANALLDAVNMAERALVFAETPESRFRRASLLDGAYARLDPRAADRQSAISAMESAAFDEASRVRSRGARARYDIARGMATAADDELAAVRERAEELGLTDEVARASATLASRWAFAGRFDEAEAEVLRLLNLPLPRSFGTQVDAYQTLAIIRQVKGAVSSSLDARKSAAVAAREAGLKEREATLTTNLGFALSTVGARREARQALERGLLLAESIGSPGSLRHAQMNLLGWAGLYGSDRRLDTFLSETRAEADAAATGYWTSPDRSNLGILFYRGVELLRSASENNRRRALAMLELSAQGYRDTANRDVLPVSLGLWAEAQRVCGELKAAQATASQAADLILGGAPSLLNESPVFLTLYKVRLSLGDESGAKDALVASIRPLLRRINGLVGSPYAQSFLTQLSHNAELVAAADAAGLLPESIQRMLTGER